MTVNSRMFSTAPEVRYPSVAPQTSCSQPDDCQMPNAVLQTMLGTGAPCPTCPRAKGKDTALSVLALAHHGHQQACPSLLCPQCSPPPPGTLTIKLQRCMQHAAVRVEDIHRVLDVSEVQPYPHKGGPVVYLKTRLVENPRMLKFHSLLGNQCRTCAAALMQPMYAFCSLKCKADAHGGLPVLLNNSDQHALPSRQSNEVSQDRWPAIVTEDSVHSSTTADQLPSFKSYEPKTNTHQQEQAPENEAGWLHAMDALLQAAEVSSHSGDVKPAPVKAQRRSTRGGPLPPGGLQVHSASLKKQPGASKRGVFLAPSVRKRCPHRAALE